MRSGGLFIDIIDYRKSCVSDQGGKNKVLVECCGGELEPDEGPL